MDHLPITFVILLLVFGAPVLSGLNPVTYCLEAPSAVLGKLPPEVVPDRVVAHLIRVELLHT